jgi:hypothetical protein
MSHLLKRDSATSRILNESSGVLYYGWFFVLTSGGLKSLMKTLAHHFKKYVVSAENSHGFIQSGSFGGSYKYADR